MSINNTHSPSKPVLLLHDKVQYWISLQGWAALNPIQEHSLVPVLDQNRDVIISAPTASGKTEAAFLPAISRLLHDNHFGLGILYISPLKSLINDQYRRLETLSDVTGISVMPWHGDVSHDRKKLFIRSPKGILLTTPESLEAILLRRYAWCVKKLPLIKYVIIDEFHAFIGTERGRQLQSLLHRIENITSTTIPRIALSATLGDLSLVQRSLRPPSQQFPCQQISTEVRNREMKLKIRGYLQSGNLENRCEIDPVLIQDLFVEMKGRNNLVFANRRALVESICSALVKQCELHCVANEFFPHHGSLAKDLREQLEFRMQQQGLFPTTAVCTSSLELGIDVGKLDCVGQVGVPSSVSALSQRIGRSGRRADSPSVGRIYIEEEPVSARSTLNVRLRFNTLQAIAMTELIRERWCETPFDEKEHYSTLVQQIISVVAQYGDASPLAIWKLLCETGPFHLVSKDDFKKLMHSLFFYEILDKLRDGVCILGPRGNKMIDDYRFYAAFETPVEFELYSNGSRLGSIPMEYSVSRGEQLIFAGRYWFVESVDLNDRIITLVPDAEGTPPTFMGTGALVDDRIRQEMFRLLKVPRDIPYLDRTAQGFYQEACDFFHATQLARFPLIITLNRFHLLTWRGDRRARSIALLLRAAGLSVFEHAGIIEIRLPPGTYYEQGFFFFSSIRNFLESPRLSIEQLSFELETLDLGKHDRFVPEELLRISAVKRSYDLDFAYAWLQFFLDKLAPDSDGEYLTFFEQYQFPKGILNYTDNLDDDKFL